MADDKRSAITRTITLSDLEPQELASIFAQYDSEKQAAFFAALVVEGADWPSTGWCGQSLYMVSEMTRPAQELLATMAAHLPDEIKRSHL